MVFDRAVAGARPIRWCVLVAAGVMVLVGGHGLAAAQEDMRPLEDALGDSLDVRRDEAPEPGPEGGTAPADTDGSSGSTSSGAARDGDGDGAPSSTDQGSDGLREPVPADGAGGERGDEDATSDGAPGSGGTPTPGGSDLDDRDEGVEGEGRGAGELVAGVPGRTVPIAIAVLALLGSGAALVLAQRRSEHTAG